MRARRVNVSGTHAKLPKLPLRLSALQIVGLVDSPDGDWVRLRRLQYSDIHRSTLARGLSHLLAATVTLAIFASEAPPALAFGWLAAVILAVWNAVRNERRLGEGEGQTMSRAEYRRHAIGLTACALVWALALAIFAPLSDRTDHFALCLVVAILVATSAASAAAAPLGTLLLALIAGGAAVISLIYAGGVSLAVIFAAFIAVAVKGSVDAARTHLSARIAEVGVAEKDQVVSLLLREFEENDADWLWQIDTARRVRSASPRFSYALGVDSAEAEGESFIRLVSGDAWESGRFPPSLHELAGRLRQRDSFSNLLVQVEIKSNRRWWELSGTPMLNEKGEFVGFRGVGSDVTERRELDEKIAYLARYDTLTGLPNRLMLTEALGEAMRHAERCRGSCAFLMVDLDRFKAVNDSLGHQVGDRLLALVSQRLDAVLTENERCGRLGGDEFAVVLRDASDPQRVREVAQNLIEALSHPYSVDDHVLHIGASVGSAIGPRDGASVETLMRNADLALYRAKDEGRGGHCAYDPSLHASAEERLKLELSLRNAIGAGELKIDFQPVVDARSKGIVGFEALLRWHSAEHGVVSPGRFIPLAEETRLIVPIGEWVLREACRSAVRWPEDIKLAVNVSGEQLLEPGFVESVVRALAETGFPARRLEIEVTESSFQKDGRGVRRALEEVIALGCPIALDDFGTGYSSLGYLRMLRFSTVKVDCSFVQGAAQGSRESLAIIRAVVAMAQSLGMNTTAEGIESAEEAAIAAELGCTTLQGYHFGRPVEAEEAFLLVNERRRPPQGALDVA